MRRRAFIGLLGGAAVAAPLVVRAQGERMRRIGILLPGAADDAELQARFGSSLQGWENWAGPSAATCESTPAKPRLMLPRFAGTRRNWPRSRRTSSWPLPPRPLLQATRTVPIVFPASSIRSAPASLRSLARPGGNVTGFMNFEYSIGGKWLELLKEIAPGVTRVAVLRYAATPSGVGQFGIIQSVAPSLRVEVTPVNMGDAPERAVAASAANPWCARRTLALNRARRRALRTAG